MIYKSTSTNQQITQWLCRTGHSLNIFCVRALDHHGDVVVTCAADGEVRLHKLEGALSHCNSTLLADHDGAANRFGVVNCNTILSVGNDGKINHVSYK